MFYSPQHQSQVGIFDNSKLTRSLYGVLSRTLRVRDTLDVSATLYSATTIVQ